MAIGVHMAVVEGLGEVAEEPQEVVVGTAQTGIRWEAAEQSGRGRMIWECHQVFEARHLHFELQLRLRPGVAAPLPSSSAPEPGECP